MRIILILFISIITFQLSFSQEDNFKAPNKFQKLLMKPDSLNKARFWTLNGTLATGYTGIVIALDQVWYAEFPRSRFHSFNDMGEWNDMDKAGHLFTAYMESKLSSQMYQWTGLNRRKSAYAGFALGTIFQGTLETLDGFSEEWGWSWGDIGFNTGGSLIFLAQELAWKEQRIVLKISSWRRPLNDFTLVDQNGANPISLSSRRNELYGTNIAEVLLKDYNALTIWGSVNIHSFMKKKDTRFPKWLNVAVGYGAENIYGGFDNTWVNEDGSTYVLPERDYKRYRQIFLSFDIDMTKIPVKNKFLKTLFSGFNILKIPAPALEFNTLGKVKFHPFYF
jgi:uncharacterized protein YfiM (DUF2279 family)